MDLLEADAYYAGLAQSVLSDAPFSRPSANDLAELADSLNALRVATPSDEAILDSCRSYFAVLKALHEVLMS